MALTTRRQFVQQTAFAVAALLRAGDRASAADLRSMRSERRSARRGGDPQGVFRDYGYVITLEAPDYESPRVVFNRCAGAPDVAVALEFAQNQNLPLVVRGGGHIRPCN